MELKGSELIFISRIMRDGSATTPVLDDDHLQEEEFEMNCLSLTKNTWIACGFNSYVVKLKNEELEK